jgi:uncharacterized protein (DUF433 family)
MKTTFRTVLRGRTIELPWDLGLPEGHIIGVTIMTYPDAECLPEPKAAHTIPPVETWMDRLVFDRAVHPTERIVKGTRLEVEALVAELDAGRSDEDLLKAHAELTADDLAAIKNYALAPVAMRRLFGAWADEAEELDKFLEWNRQQRKQDRRGIDE